MDELPLFVFGTLRRGEANHHCLAGAYERVLSASVKGFRKIIATHGFPTIIPAANEYVFGEMFILIPQQRMATLACCDKLEEIPPGSLDGSLYCRAKVTVETAEGTFLAWAYVDPVCTLDADRRVVLH